MRGYGRSRVQGLQEAGMFESPRPFTNTALTMQQRQPLANLAVIRTSLRCLCPGGPDGQAGTIRRGSEVVEVEAGQGQGEAGSGHA